MWSLEEKLLINHLRLTSKPNHAHGFQNSLIDWDSFIKQSAHHGLSGLIYALSRQPEHNDIFPQRVFNFLKQEYYKNIINNMRLLKALQTMVGALNKEGIYPLFFQGAALLLTQTYSSLGMRPLTDLDFLIAPDQKELAGQVLQELGYRPLLHYPDLFANQTIVLDMHTETANSARIQARKYAVKITTGCLWQEACANKASWGTAYTLSGEDLIITSAAHLQKHSYSRLIWFVDMMNILNHYSARFDWQKTVTRAKKFNLEKPIYFSLVFLKQTFNYQPAAISADKLLDVRLNLIERKILSGLLAGKRLDKIGDFLYLSSIKSPVKKLLYLKENIFPKREVMAQVFGFSNPFAVGLCYPVRFFQSLWYGIKLIIPLVQRAKRQA